ncbi:MAG: hypothetical protein AAF458_21785 [Pseudomonadota bacterium]
MVSKDLIAALFDTGLGELLLLHVHDTQPVLGQIVKEKGRLVLKDRGLLRGVHGAQVGPCCDIGMVGAVTAEEGLEWESLTFSGPEHCHLKQDLSSTRVGLMSASTNEFNERLIDFRGSVHRGFRLMLDNHFLPVILMQEVVLKTGQLGLAVSNLRMANVSFDVLGAVHEKLNDLVQKNIDVEVEDVTIDNSDFESLFGQYTRAQA